MKQPSEKDLRQAFESKDKNVVIDFALQYKWERDFFERQFKKANKALDVAITLAIDMNTNWKTMQPEDKQDIREHIKVLSFELLELGGKNETEI